MRPDAPDELKAQPLRFLTRCLLVQITTADCFASRREREREGGGGGGGGGTEESVTVFNKSRSSFLLLTINVFSLLQILSRSLEMIRSRKPSINCVPFEKR